jgi:hypothetical protein
LFQWFLTLFIYSFPLSYIQDLLNFIVVKRHFAAVRLAVAILQCLEKYISGKNMKEDSFVECFDLLKNEEFCRKFLPLETIIKKAQKISHETIMICLRECSADTDNWYRTYFLLTAPKCHKEYNKRMTQLQNERDLFHAEDEGSQSGRYTRLNSHTNILDSIE